MKIAFLTQKNVCGLYFLRDNPNLVTFYHIGKPEWTLHSLCKSKQF